MITYEPIDEPAEILLVEDDEDDILFITEAFAEVWQSYNIHTVTDGAQAISFLKQEGEFASAPRPDLILLDLNMPRVNGYEVLAFAKSDDDLKRIPIVVLTTASDDRTRDEVYASHANSFIAKPSLPSELNNVVRMVAQYWLGTAKQ